MSGTRYNWRKSSPLQGLIWRMCPSVSVLVCLFAVFIHCLQEKPRTITDLCKRQQAEGGQAKGFESHTDTDRHTHTHPPVHTPHELNFTVLFSDRRKERAKKNPLNTFGQRQQMTAVVGCADVKTRRANCSVNSSLWTQHSALKTYQIATRVTWPPGKNLFPEFNRRLLKGQRINKSLSALLSSSFPHVSKRTHLFTEYQDKGISENSFLERKLKAIRKR